MSSQEISSHVEWLLLSNVTVSKFPLKISKNSEQWPENYFYMMKVFTLFSRAKQKLVNQFGWNLFVLKEHNIHLQRKHEKDKSSPPGKAASVCPSFLFSFHNVFLTRCFSHGKNIIFISSKEKKKQLRGKFEPLESSQWVSISQISLV